MQSKSEFSDDELKRRREARRRKAQAEAAMQNEDDEEDEELPKFTWSDTFAMIIAAYQVLLPMLLAMVGTIILAYFLFIWIFA